MLAIKIEAKSEKRINCKKSFNLIFFFILYKWWWGLLLCFNNNKIYTLILHKNFHQVHVSFSCIVCLYEYFKLNHIPLYNISIFFVLLDFTLLLRFILYFLIKYNFFILLFFTFLVIFLPSWLKLSK